MDFVSKLQKKYSRPGPSLPTDKWTLISDLPAFGKGWVRIHFAVSDKRIFAGTDAGLFYSTDNGLSWPAANLIPTVVTSIIFRGKDLIIGTEATGVRLYADFGKRSVGVYPGLAARHPVSHLAVIGDIAYALNAGIRYSTDHGKSWTELGTGLSEIKALFAHRINLYAATDKGLYLSADNGKEWILLSCELRNILDFACSGDNLYISTLDNDGNHNLCRSADNGKSWIPTDTGLDYNMVHSIAVSGNSVFAGGQGVSCSSDNGESWTIISEGFPKDDERLPSKYYVSCH